MTKRATMQDASARAGDTVWVPVTNLDLDRDATVDLGGDGRRLGA